ncbi:MAG: valine--tRNA ligase [Rickettsiaceae bacterium]|nr:MAG: valine--tRNA ligase [Rickettsiaceae bacterium]
MLNIAGNYDFKEKEQKWQIYWQKQEVYKWDKNASRSDSFIVDTPPPTVSGQLHIGHVYSYTQADFIVRFQRMLGKNVFYPIGFDDNGLPTERLVEKQKNVKAYTMKRQDFVDLCQNVIAEEEQKFKNLFISVGLSVDWELEYQTISRLSQKISQLSFLDLMQKNEVYRSEQPVLWDPIDQTALAQADIEDKEKTSFMNYVVFYTTEGDELSIATTRPELLAACTAIFYHPADSRYNKLEGMFANTPLFNVKVPILPDELVQQDKGTGLVMCCTFGDQTDILWWKKHKLPTKIIISKAGKIELDQLCFAAEAEGFAKQINGLKITEARNKIINILQTEGLLTKQVEILQTVKCAERSGGPLEILTTPQWFIKTLPHKQSILNNIQQLNWHPITMKIKLENWISSIGWDWCISRQRYFGVPFPVWYSKKIGEEGKIIYAHPSQLPIDPLKDLPLGYKHDEVEPDTDVMDTWATSALTPQLSSHGISEESSHDNERHQKLFPADLRVQAHEILRTWAYYTLLKAHVHQNVLPWKNIMISGWCLANDRSKMSKSKGNIITPSTLLEQYGADVIRYWSSSSNLGADTCYSEDVMKNGKRLVNKLWNAAKFISIHFDLIQDSDKQAHLTELKSKIFYPTDQWLINQLVELTNKVEQEMLAYEYSSAIQIIEQFFIKSFCDNYLEITKIRAYNETNTKISDRYSAILTLYQGFQIILKLFAPFLPHITEEIYQQLYAASSIHSRSSWPKLPQKIENEKIDQVDNLIQILDWVRKFKTSKNISIKAPIQLIEIKGQFLSEEIIADLKDVTSAIEIKFVENFVLNPDSEIFAKENFSVSIV